MNLTQSENRMQGKFDKFVENRPVMYGVLFLLSFFTLLLFSFSSSPLFPYHYGYDGAFFMVFGKAMVAGKVPYLELFDHKGPALFYLQALAQFICPGKVGIFSIQVVSLSICLVLLWKTTLIFTRSALQIAITIISFLMLLVVAIHNGNQCEEYSLLHAMVGVYFAVRFYFTDNKHISWWKIVILGLCFSLSFWMRANNAAMVSACFAFIFLVLFQNRQWKELWKLTLIFIATIVAFSLLIIVYFYSINALDEMIYATFTFNFRYLGGSWDFVWSEKTRFILLLVALVVSLAMGSYLFYKENKDKNVLLFAFCLFILGIVPMCSIRMFEHYLTASIPAFSVGLMFFFASGRKLNKFVKRSLLLLGILPLTFIPKIMKVINKPTSFNGDYTEAINEAKSMIPQSEYDQIYTYGLDPAFYMISGIKPYYKYFMYEEVHGRISEEVFHKIDTMLIQTPPKWVVMKVDLDSAGFNPIVMNRLKADYSKYGVATKGQTSLYLYKKRRVDFL